MIKLAPNQETDLQELTDVCGSMQVELVIIGATAYRMFVDDPYRQTLDVDIAVAVELDDFPDLVRALSSRGWNQSDKQEHRWRAGSGTIIDLLPAGVRLRVKKELVWPRTGMTMSLVGFDHVFNEAVAKRLPSGLVLKVIPLHVFALLKIVAFLDGREEREKDARDIGALLGKYEIEGERRFGDEVYDSGMTLQFDQAGSLLLGLDLGRLCVNAEAEIVQTFLNMIADNESQAFAIMSRQRRRFAEYDEQDQELRRLVQAFAEGFRRSRQTS